LEPVGTQGRVANATRPLCVYRLQTQVGGSLRSQKQLAGTRGFPSYLESRALFARAPVPRAGTLETLSAYGG